MDQVLEPRQAVERRYRGRLPDERRAERRRRLLDAGLELFGTVGYHGTSIERLCARAGVTARHFYQEFPGREALLDALCQEVITEVAQAVLDVLVDALGQTPRSRTRAAISAFVHGMLDDPRRARVVCIEMTGISPELERTRQEALYGFARITQAEIERSADAGWIARRDHHLAALVAVGGTRELVMEWVSGDRSLPLDALIQELTRILRGDRRAGSLGGVGGRTLFMMAAEWNGPANMVGAPRTGQVLTAEAPAPGAGWP